METKREEEEEEGSATEPKRTATQEATACVDKGYMQKWIITRA